MENAIYSGAFAYSSPPEKSVLLQSEQSHELKNEGFFNVQ